MWKKSPIFQVFFVLPTTFERRPSPSKQDAEIHRAQVGHSDEEDQEEVRPRRRRSGPGEVGPLTAQKVNVQPHDFVLPRGQQVKKVRHLI